MSEDASAAPAGDDATASAATATAASSAAKPCVFMKKRRRGQATQRKRPAPTQDRDESDESEDSGADEPLVAAASSSAVRRGAMVATSKSAIKKPKRFAYESTRSELPEGPRDGGATATLEIDTEHTKDHQAMYERAQAMQRETGDDGTYKGMAAYQQFTPADRDGEASTAYKKLAKGPLRAPSNLRATVRWDYAPDICKDYKETGFCGYGDTCKFLHDRSDYKHGWQIDQELEQGNQEPDDVRKYEIHSDSEEELPFACFICREDFDRPVVSTCGHYFCEKCALDHHRKSRKCAACGAKTGGIFKPAKNLLAKIGEREERVTNKALDG